MLRRSIFHQRKLVTNVLRTTIIGPCGTLSHRPLFYLPKKRFSGIPTSTFELISAATYGDIVKLEELLKDKNLNINEGDYDLRTALHLAAAEGNVEVCSFLLSNGAEINVFDRSGYTPLECALAEGHAECIEFLREKGGVINEERRDFLTKSMLDAASLGNVDQLKQLLDAGAKANDSDYDYRTPLHLASSEGRVEAVEFLLQNGAEVNPVDRFGNSPLEDAMRGSERGHKAAAQVLYEKGGTSGGEAFLGVSLLASIQRSIEALFNRGGGFDYCEFWIPSSDAEELIFQDGFSSFDASLSELEATPRGKIIANGTANPFGKCWHTQKPQLCTEISEKSLYGRSEIARAEGISTFLIIPIRCDDHLHGVLALFAKDTKQILPKKEFSSYSDFSSRLITAGVFGSAKTPEFDPIDGVPEGQQAEVFQHILAKGVFNANIVYAAIDWFYRIKLPSIYFATFPVEVLANHIHAFIAGRRLASVTGDRERLWVHIENDPKFFGKDAQPEQALMMIPVGKNHMRGAEARLEDRLNVAPADKSLSVEFFHSEGTIVKDGTKQLAIYVLSSRDYANPNVETRQTSNSLWDVASESFLASKPAVARKRYQDIMTQASNQLSSVSKVFEDLTPEGYVHAMITSRSGKMLHLTELLNQSDIIPKKKFLQKFGNDIDIYSLYVAPENRKKLKNVLQQYSVLNQIPISPVLTPRFLRGEMKADDLTYFISASRFIYYFLDHRTAEFDSLEESLKSDPLNLGRLRMMYTSLKREAASRPRISEVAIKYPEIVSELNLDLRARVSRNWAKEGKIGENEKLLKRIENEADDPLDKELLLSLLNFNKCVLKTNLSKKSKSTIAFRIDTSKLNASWPVCPYGMFFILGSEFQGFHIRFEDISRGGIRLIPSHNQAHYNKNLSTLFAENYGLAFTQNLKNKDIPEFGSKGTILLNPDSRAQKNKFLNFKKYISGLMDLIIQDDEINDNLGQEELLFLGPDEGTADMMEWAANYSNERGYSYWRALTTGKPPSMGGIPHDTFGMTTRSVHRYVVGALAKLGLDESKVTKIQTGGPDGDLGSNEILISKDKTKAIIDGSGVVYDPEGLDRKELTRLATERHMINEFNNSQLGPGGFKVLIDDHDVTLPDGSIVDNGLAFRNNFHLHPLCTADLFVPCGGRPEAVNLTNIDEFLTIDGEPRFNIIVEGANLFFTNDARMVIADHGVYLFKDASTNKGGVTSSSKEVFCSLALREAEFKKGMLVEDTNDMPEFYNQYCHDVIDQVEENADLEFECLWAEHEASGTPHYILTEELSEKINTLNQQVAASNLWDKKEVRDKILMKSIPKTLTNTVSLEDIYATCPESYLRAMFSCYVASRYVYTYGIKASDFAFYDFMENI